MEQSQRPGHIPDQSPNDATSGTVINDAPSDTLGARDGLRTSPKTSVNRVGTFTRATAWLAISWERFWPLIVPFALVALVFASISWLGLWQLLPTPAHIALLAAISIIGGYSLTKLRFFETVTSADVDRRIEVASELEHRPILAQHDDLELGGEDSMSRALWNTHKERMAQRLKDMNAGDAKAHGGRFDALGLRFYLPILAFVALAASLAPNGGSMRDAMHIGPDPQQLLSRFDIWANPPSYTGKPPIYLSTKNDSNDARSILLPQHSELVARFAGENDGDIRLQFDDGDNALTIENIAEDGDPTSKNYNHKLTRSGIISVHSGNKQLTQWSVRIIEDQKPKIFFNADPKPSLAGSLELNYGVSDDYGVVIAQGRITPLDESSREKNSGELPAYFVPGPNARPLVKLPKFRLPLPRNRAKSGIAKTNRDLTKHPLAGSMVQLTLHAKDDSGQEGVSEAKTITLPGRRFSHPVSRALIEQRRILALDANQQFHVANMLDALSTAPEKFLDNATAHIAMRMAYRRLLDARNDKQLEDVLDFVWEIALGIEFGRMSEAERRLREAQEKLSEALENDASNEEIAKLMKELRQAMNELMQALAEQARKNPQANNPLDQNQNSQMLRQSDLERMMDQIENLARSGSKDAARQLLSEMQRMMDNLRAGRHQQQRQAEGNEMNQALDKLSRLMQRQQELMNETFRMERNQPRDFNQQDMQRKRNQQGQQNRNNRQGQQQDNQRQRGDGQQQSPGQQGEMSPQEFADALEQLREQQQALQQQLDALSKQLQSLGVDPSKEFGEAGREMGEAGEGLGQGRPGEASQNQGRALEALRKGAQTMMQQMAGDRQNGGQQQGQGQSQGNQRMSRDPLGRNRGTNGPDFGEDVKIPGEIDAQMARRILEEIRKRMSNPLQPLLERDYLERLLKSR